MIQAKPNIPRCSFRLCKLDGHIGLRGEIKYFARARVVNANDAMTLLEGNGFNGFAHFSIPDQQDVHGIRI